MNLLFQIGNSKVQKGQTVILFITCALLLFTFVSHGDCDRVKILSRAKRFLWMTHNRKMVLPKGTILDIAPRLQIPFIRQPPEGLNSDIQVTWHFYMYFDKLGMTSDTHPWPPKYPFSGFFPSGSLPYPRPQGEPSTISKKTYPPRPSSAEAEAPHYQFEHPHTSNEINAYLNAKYKGNLADAKYKTGSQKSNQTQSQTQTQTKPVAGTGTGSGTGTKTGTGSGTGTKTGTESGNNKNDQERIIIKASQPINEGQGKSTSRKPRSVLSLPPPDSLPGGERAILIPQLEKMISSMGYDGRACLLRTVCEVHEFPLHRTGFGLLGEIVTLVFSISLSEYADSHMSEYLKAEEAGRAGECSAYFRKCSKSLFMWEEKSKYSEEMQNVVHTRK